MLSGDALNGEFARARPDAFVRVLGRSKLAEVTDVIARLPPELAPSIVARLPASQVLAIMGGDASQIDAWLSACPFNDATALLSRLPKERRMAMIEKLGNRQRRQQLLRQQRYPSHSVGALVRDVTVRLSADTEVAEVRSVLSELDQDSGPIVIVDSQGRYAGDVDFRALASRAAERDPIGNFARLTRPIRPETSISLAAAEHQYSEHTWLPVVDHQEQLLGCARRADLLRGAGSGLPGSDPGHKSLLDFLDDAALALAMLLETVLGRRTGR